MAIGSRKSPAVKRRAWSRLGLLLLLPATVVSWRSECDTEGIDVEVTFHGSPAASEVGPGVCRVAFLTHEDLVTAPPEEDFGDPDVVFTDSLLAVPFNNRRGRAHFLENITQFKIPPDLGNITLTKPELLSVLLPPPERWDGLIQSIAEQAQALLPEHIYIDDGRPETYDEAFRRYRFCLIAESANHTISQAFITSVAYHTIGVFNGFVEVGAMVFNGVADFVEDPFSFEETHKTIERHNKFLGALHHYHEMLRDQVAYRYNRPFEERLFSQACTLCRQKAVPPPVGTSATSEPPLVFVGIYSARANFEKRRVVRETWGRILHEEFGVRYTFFLGEAEAGGALNERRMRRESETYGDMVFLEAKEGYRMNSRKGLMFLEWIAVRSEAEFLLKVDDDVYFRPAPLLAQLRNRPSAQYAWGYWDYNSPVPRTEGDPFYNTPEEHPSDVFPPYPRGVVRVLSMDIVRLLADAGRRGALRTIFGDDPCIGVHLQQLIHDEVEPLPSLALDDFDNRVFAMEPSCHSKLWSKMSNRSWAVHHVTPAQIECMWNVDLRDGYLVETEAGIRHHPDFALDELPNLCECETDPSFYDRTDTDDLKQQADRILYGDGRAPLRGGGEEEVSGQ